MRWLKHFLERHCFPGHLWSKWEFLNTQKEIIVRGKIQTIFETNRTRYCDKYDLTHTEKV